MHVAVSEYARHVVGLEGANSTEMDPETPFPVIDLLPEQKEIEDLGGTMRLGAQAVELAEGTRALSAYNELVVHERHRHRFELRDHPWFVASQFHPEFKSRPTRPAPLFRDFVGAAFARSRERSGAAFTISG
jgi:CTP synthase